MPLESPRLRYNRRRGVYEGLARDGVLVEVDKAFFEEKFAEPDSRDRSIIHYWYGSHSFLFDEQHVRIWTGNALPLQLRTLEPGMMLQYIPQAHPAMGPKVLLRSSLLGYSFHIVYPQEHSTLSGVAKTWSGLLKSFWRLQIPVQFNWSLVERDKVSTRVSFPPYREVAETDKERQTQVRQMVERIKLGLLAVKEWMQEQPVASTSIADLRVHLADMARRLASAMIDTVRGQDQAEEPDTDLEKDVAFLITDFLIDQYFTLWGCRYPSEPMLTMSADWLAHLVLNGLYYRE